MSLLAFLNVISKFCIFSHNADRQPVTGGETPIPLKLWWKDK
jgi:hypothetical protein